MNTARTLQSLCSGISEQPAQLSKAPTASDHKRGKLLSKTPHSGGGMSSTQLCKAKQHPSQCNRSGWLAPTHPAPSKAGAGRLQRAIQPARRTCHALQATACQACRGQVGRAPRSERTILGVLAAGESRCSPPAPPAPPPAPRGRGVRKGSQAAFACSRALPLPPLHSQTAKRRCNTWRLFITSSSGQKDEHP